jgi:hypothetical protein
MVPDFRRDDVWTPVSAGVTLQESFYEIIKLHLFGKFEFRASIFEFMCRRG